MGSEFKVLHCSVCVQRSCRQGSCNAIVERKSNVVMHLGIENLSEECLQVAGKMLGICSAGIFQKTQPKKWRPAWVQPLQTWRREEPQFLYEDSAFMVLMKPATWHCSSQDQGRTLLKESRTLDSDKRKERLHQLLSQSDTPALHDYLILRFGSDPSWREVMREENLYGMVHRLDVGTTGSLLVARNKESFAWAKEQVIRQEFIRDYIALVHGTFSRNAPKYPSRGLIVAPIDKSNYDRTRRCEIRASGQFAATHYECLAEFRSKGGQNYSLVHCRLLTGRTHQIRVHCEYIGLPLVGDERYTRNRAPHDPHVVCARPFLHKVRFVFATENKEPVVVWTPLVSADDLLDVLRQLKLVDWRGVRTEDLARLMKRR